jgi:hypothetical protein
MTNCHCITCRKIGGGAFITFADFEPASCITWKGQSAIKRVRFSDIAERGFCGDCGSTLFMSYDFQLKKIAIAAGSIDEDTVKGELPKPTQGVYTGEGWKAGWWSVPDSEGLENHNTFPAVFQEKVDRWKQEQGHTRGVAVHNSAVR